ncbi:NUDIX domain-containing protein [Kiloniella laminariae]|uniref:NUDIX domain-containing protein n=1 Tax=Kiloniella laminariae TaxID=454162 RepID=A0ABT4LHS7_9PROT|nr:NUDIX domain-containing protein [Kiloniella laminariae]MCZ4280654.1 NUDIX domain-containing protein [Kiloniella laminariae]
MKRRRAVRAVMLSPDKRILLAKMQYAHRVPLWLTPGGGLEGEEDPVHALRRELNEEIFVSDWKIGPAVWTREHCLIFKGSEICVNEIFYLIEAAKFVPPQAMPDENENQNFQGYHWWSIAEIIGSDEVFVPEKIGFYLPDLIEGVIPDKPVEVGV